MMRVRGGRRAATLGTLVATIVLVAGIVVVVAPLTRQYASAQEGIVDVEDDLNTDFIDPLSDLAQPYAPMTVSQDGNNVYVVWWTNKSENWEVMFRASNDGGQTFGDKINLSNSTDAESQNADIVAAGNNRVLVSWWETNPVTGSSESVLRVSNDAGQTFGSMIRLGVNGTITTTGNNTTTAPERGAGGEQQQCQLEITTDDETYEAGEPVSINVTNSGDEALEFPNSVLGLEMKNGDTGQVYPLFSTQVITKLESGESRTFEFTYEELVSEIGTGTIEARASSDGCSASTTFTLA